MTVELAPLEVPLPLRVADVSVTAVAGSVITVGAVHGVPTTATLSRPFNVEVIARMATETLTPFVRPVISKFAVNGDERPAET